jgi:hypothetical protein
MIVMALLNPVAFLLTVALGVGALFGLERFGIEPTDDSWWDVVLYLGLYVALMMVLPWWTRPVELWRYWRGRRG